MKKGNILMYGILLIIVLIFVVAKITIKSPTYGSIPDSSSSSEPEIKPANSKIDFKNYSTFHDLQSDTVADVIISFNGFKVSTEFIHDRYGDEYRVHRSERGEKYITCEVSIKSLIKDPSLPCIFLYSANDGMLERVAAFNYFFYSWKGYGEYLGNSHDSKNDFAYTENIKFSIGASVDDSILKSRSLFILVSKMPSINREENRFSEPPVKYPCADCYNKSFSLMGNEKIEMYDLISIMNKKYLK